MYKKLFIKSTEIMNRDTFHIKCDKIYFTISY